MKTTVLSRQVLITGNLTTVNFTESTLLLITLGFT